MATLPAPASVTLTNGAWTVTVDAGRGGRVASLLVDDTQFLVTDDTDDPLGWGAYPMVPFAGRVRNAVLRFGGRDHPLRRNATPHSIHGTVCDAPWLMERSSPTAVSMTCDLGPHWPFGGRVRHEVYLTNAGLRCELTVEAADMAMPAQVGWHPWFVPEAWVTFAFGAMLARDADGITTSQRVAMPNGPVDDCFIGPESWPCVTLDGITLEVRSDCSHWVVYNQSPRGTCVEPQSGAPNAVNDHPVVLQPGESLTHWMELVRVDRGRARH